MPSDRDILRMVALVFGILIEVATGIVHLIAVLADAVAPFLGFVNTVFLQEVGPLLQVSRPLQVHYATWSSVVSIVGLVWGLRWGKRGIQDQTDEKRAFATALLVLLTALFLTVVYPSMLEAYDTFLRSTNLQGAPLIGSNVVWSLLLVVVYSMTFGLISFGMTLIAAIAYHHARDNL